jgi:Phage derived protein Gp49-like (DUF891)
VPSEVPNSPPGSVRAHLYIGAMSANERQPPLIWLYQSASGERVLIKEILALDARYPGCGAQFMRTTLAIANGTAAPRHVDHVAASFGPLLEERFTFQGMEFRLLFAFEAGGSDTQDRPILLGLVAFRKRQQKLPRHVKELAEEGLRDHRERRSR